MISNPQNHLYTSAISKEADTDRTDGPTTSVASSASQWETNIVVAFNVSSVDVNSNMGNVMGQATYELCIVLCVFAMIRGALVLLC